jgi:hypothetical protein
MTVTATASMRQGIILRTLPHGTVIVWDQELKRSYPYYKAGTSTFSNMEHVRFSTDDTDTVVLAVERADPPKKRIGRRDHAGEPAVKPHHQAA